MRWTKKKRIKKHARTGWSHFSDDGNWEISDEGPKPWTLLRRNIAGQFTHYAEFKSLPEAKRAAVRGATVAMVMQGG